MSRQENLETIHRHNVVAERYGLMSELVRELRSDEHVERQLDEAGWESSGDGPRTKDGEELSFDLYVRSESQFNIQAAKLIAEAVTAMAFGASSEDLARTCHAHPTLPEAVKEAALAVDGRAIHF